MDKTEKIVQQPAAVTSQHQFDSIPGAEVERSTFDRSHGWKAPLPLAGLLYPCLVDETVPGDTFTCNATAFVRLATPLHPIMDRLHVDMHFFSVATRLVYPEFNNLMGERAFLGDKPENYSIPQLSIDLSDWQFGTRLADFMGLPLGQTGTVSVSALFFRAYDLTWSEWFRDQNLQEPLDITLTDANAQCRPRNKRKDYFTSCLPFPQKGDEVIVPIGDTALVGVRDKQTLAQPTTGNFTARTDSPDGTKYYHETNLVDGTQEWIQDTTNTAINEYYTDLSTATSTSINDLRTAFQIQRLLERDARSGTRYVEITLAHFAVMSDDRRQFRPEYLGGGSAVMSTVPVANTAGYDDGTTGGPQGSLAAVSTGLCQASWSKSWTEHSIVLGLISIRSDLTYQNGIERMWFRSTRYDFYWPVFAHLGEQAVLNREIFVDGTVKDTEIFGYQERWAEMRYKPSRVCGAFRSNYTLGGGSLDPWHLAQDFQVLPTLADTFRRDTPPVDRVVAVPAEPHFLADVWFDYKCTRPMPVYSVPGFIDHF